VHGANLLPNLQGDTKNPPGQRQEELQHKSSLPLATSQDNLKGVSPMKGYILFESA